MATTLPHAAAHPVNGIAARPTPALPDISGTMVLVTPSMAADMLKGRPPNRPLSKSRVYVMIGDMRSGRWRSNGEPIILDQDGRLIDGQHRLQAVLESGIATPFLVVIGVASADAESID